MNNNATIVVIEDDIDDKDLLTEAFNDLKYPNKINFFSDSRSAFQYLTTTSDVPFLILSDINLPGMTGMELKEKLYAVESFRSKNIPYIFYTTNSRRDYIADAFSSDCNGIFLKPNNYMEVVSTIRTIVEYWQLASHR